MNKQWAVVSGLLLALVVGCEGDTGPAGPAGPAGPQGPGGTGIIGLASLFPEIANADHNVSDDGLAFTNSFSKVGNGQLNVFWNCANNTALVIYVDNLGHVWAHYWDGSAFTPPVELRGPNQDFNVANDDNDTSADDQDEFFVLFHVVWLTTATHPNANAVARDGDALITWVAEEGQDGDQSNGDDRLFGTYFDVSAAGSASTTDTNSGETVRYGFYPGTVINDNTGTSDVQNFGFVSDSLHYSHDFFVEDRSSDSHVNQPEADLSGDTTTFVHIVWNQAQGSFRRFFSLEFDLTQAGAGTTSANRMPVQSASEAGELPLPATYTLQGGTEPDFVVHNGDMIWKATTSAPITANSLFLTRFATGAPDTIILSTDFSVAGATVPDADQPVGADVYGGDHGLLALYVFFQEANGGPDSLMCAKSDLDGGSLAREVQDIDAGSDDVVHSTIPAPNRRPLLGATRINRTNEWIAVLWTQLSGGQTLVHGNVVQTRHALASAARTLAESVGTAAVVPNQDMSISVRTSNIGSGFTLPRYCVQYELANGYHTPAGGFQSDSNRVNFSIRQATNANGSNPELDDFLHNGLVITLNGGAPVAAPTFAFAVPGASPAGLIMNGAFDEQEAVADRGTSDGAPIVYYLAEDASRDIRLFVWTPGATAGQLVSTAGAPEENADVNRIRMRTTPVSFTAPGSHGGDNLHVFFTEPPTIGGERPTTSDIDASGRSLRSRYLDKSALVAALGGAGTVDDALRDSHVPTLDINCMTLDRGQTQEDTQMPPHLPRDDDNEKGPEVTFATSSGNTVGIYFRTRQDEINEGGHVYYQEFDGTTSTWYRTSAGDGDPQVVDTNNFQTGLFGGQDNAMYVFARHYLENTLNRTMAFYAKPQVNDAAVGKWRRWYVKVRD